MSWVKLVISGILVFGCLAARAQLVVTVAAPVVSGQKAVVRLRLENRFPERIEAARAATFLLDERGKMVATATKWVIGGQAGPGPKPGLQPGATNIFNFVVGSDKPFSTTNLTAKVAFSRVVLEGGKVADPSRDVRVFGSGK